MMTPRERVLAALAHDPPDRLPCDFWAEEPTWRRLFAHVGYADKQRLLDELEVDVRHLDVPELPEREVGGGVYQNFWGERYIYQETPWGPMREDVRGALADATSFGALESFPWPDPDQLDYTGLAAQCDSWNEHALLYGFADVWQRPALVRGWEGMFLDMLEHPDWVHFLCRTFTDFYKADYIRAAEVTRGRIDLYLLISDLGSQLGPLISLDMFREFVAPYIREMADCIHSLGGKVLYHSCGSIRTFIDELIALGIDCLDPIQPTGPQMAPEQLQAEFGGRISFHGGLDMQRLLTRGTPDQVQAEVRRYRDVLGRQGGYILAPAHLFQPDVPPDNILAVYQADRRLTPAP